MTVTFPYALAVLSDILEPGDITFHLRQNNEMSGAGDGRFWTAQLAPPLWSVAINLGQTYNAFAREIDAKIRALGEGANTFLFEDKTYWPAGGQYPGGSVTVQSISGDRRAIRLQGLPSGYKIYPGDRFSAVFGGRYYFGEFAEGSNTAPADIDTRRPTVPPVAPTPAISSPVLTVTPPLPLAATAGVAVELFRPILRAQVPPGGYKGFTGTRFNTRSGASLTILQKV